MARPNQEAIDTFIGITGVPEAVAVQKLEEHNGDLNAALNAHFSEGDRNMPMAHQTATAAPEDDDPMDIDDPVEVEPFLSREYCICLCADEDGTEQWMELPCHHHFHVTCISRWLAINATRPLCKFNI